MSLTRQFWCALAKRTPAHKILIRVKVALHLRQKSSACFPVSVIQLKCLSWNRLFALVTILFSFHVSFLWKLNNMLAIFLAVFYYSKLPFPLLPCCRKNEPFNDSISWERSFLWGMYRIIRYRTSGILTDSCGALVIECSYRRLKILPRSACYYTRNIFYSLRFAHVTVIPKQINLLFCG